MAADDDGGQFKTRLTGFQEVVPILTDGKGTFSAQLNSAGTALSYTLTFSGLSSTPLFSHIHFAEPAVNGAIMVFLCGGGGKPTCPATGGTVTGTITATDVLSISAQGITAGDFAGLLKVLANGDAYVNVHSTDHPGGEIRGQVRRDD